MQNQSLRAKSSGAGISCDGNRYIFPLKTLAVGSAVNWSLIIGFCAAALRNKIVAAIKNISDLFIFIGLFLMFIQMVDNK
jgi:hypothetical protein